MQLHMPIHREMLCICSYQCGSVLWYLFVYQRDYMGLLAMRIFICWLILYSFCGMTFSIQWLHNAFRKQTQELQKINKQTNKQTKPNQAKPNPTQSKPTNQQTNKQTNKQRSKEQKGTNKRKKQRKTETTKQTNNAMNLSKPLLVTLHWKRWQPHRLQPRSRPSSAPLFEAFVCDVKCCLCCLFQDETW